MKGKVMYMKSNRKVIISVIIVAAVVLGGFAIYSLFENNTNGDSYLSKEEAKRIAFVHAGVEEGITRNVGVDVDYENNRRLYQIEFDSAEFEYDYIIDAKTGEILYHEQGYATGRVDYD